MPPTSGVQLSDEKITSISGSISGFAATFAKQPIQRIKWIRQVDSGAAIPYNEVLRSTLRTDGPLGLFRGSVAAIMRNVPHSALVYTIYPKCEAFVLQQQQQQGNWLLHSDGSSSPTSQQHSSAAGAGSKHKPDFSTRFWAGYATLFMATLVTHPLDTLRVRISVQHGERVDTAAMVRSTLQHGGIRTLYQGFGATLIGAGPRGALGFGVFETLKDFAERSATNRSCYSLLSPQDARLDAAPVRFCANFVAK